ncbi:MAG: dipeptidase PepE [Planctomycetes bacterium]|nr:dipeptidase PepE [Planctomycetota bacterium]
MFDRFSERNKKILSAARLAAVRLQHDYIGSEHILLAILESEDSTARGLLERMGVDIAAMHADFERGLTPGPKPVEAGQLPFTPRSKRVLEEAAEEAICHGHNWMGSEHLLIGLLAVDTPAAKALAAAGVDIDLARAEMLVALTRREIEGHRPLRLLLISNSTMHGGGYLEHCGDEIRDFLGDGARNVAFVPYALADHDAYEAKAQAAFGALGHFLRSVHHERSPRRALANADAVFVGGGNTFRLLNALAETGLLRAIRQSVHAGMSYIGSSAGTNVATLSIKTTNDMPIVEPPSFRALRLVPFQINPHYLDPDPGSRHMGETREERIVQFHEENDTPVLGLREGCMLRVENHTIELRGTTGARLFQKDRAPEEFTPVCDLSFLLKSTAR